MTSDDASKPTKLIDRLRSMVLLSEISNEQTARSIVLGVASGFLPFPGFQTPFLVPISFVFRLNFPLMYLFNWITNNWFTVGPITISCYLLGKQLLAMAGFPQENIEFSVTALNWDLFQIILLPLVAGSLPITLLLPTILYFPVLAIVKRLRAANEVEG